MTQAAVTHAPHIPGAMRIAVRDAGCRLARSPNGGTLQSDHMARTPVGTNRTESKKLSQLKEVNSTSVERTTLGLPLCGAAVNASLAPTQPPPPAGLASDPACKLINLVYDL